LCQVKDESFNIDSTSDNSFDPNLRNAILHNDISPWADIFRIPEYELTKIEELSQN
jgi:hypothetical protein